jgi:hypothetical protein
VLGSALTWLERSGLAAAVQGSLMLTASLSAIHLLGVTLVGGGALVSGLRSAGLLFADRPLVEIVRPAGRAMLLGLAINLATGLLLVGPRASAAAANVFFQFKMGFLAAAVMCQALLYVRVRAAPMGAGATRVVGVIGAALCFGVIVAGSAYILLEY